MTLGGLALSVGILVDQAIVTIENIERHLHARHAAARRDPRRRRRDRRAGVRLDAVHLHRVRADVLPRRASRASCSCRWRGGGVRDDRLLHPVADAGADAGDAADGRRARATPAARGRARCSASTAPSTRQFERVRARLHARRWRALLEQARRASRSPSSPSALLSCLLYPVLGRDFFPSVDAGQIRLHFRAADRHAHRGDRAHRRRDRGGDPRADPEGPARDHPRQPRRAQQQHQPRRTATPAPSARSTARS